MRIFSKLLKLIIAIGSVLVYIFIAAGLMERYYMCLYGKDAIYYTNNNSFGTAIVAVLIFFGMMVYYWSKDGLKEPYWTVTEEEGMKSDLPVKKKVKRSVGAFVIVCFVHLICANWYTRFTLDGAEIHHLFWHNSYTWEDVDYYKLDNHYDNTLAMKVVMKDGKSLNLQFYVLATNSDGYEEMFYENDMEFMVWLNRRLAADGKELRIEDSELTEKSKKKLLRKLEYGYWDEVAEQIIEEYESKSGSWNES